MGAGNGRATGHSGGGTSALRTATGQEPVVEIRRSARRRRTVSAYRNGDRVVVLVPARLPAAEEQRWVDTMVTRIARREARSRPGDAALGDRAADLSRRYLDGAAQPTSVRWSTRQQLRWGSCTPTDGTIRLSTRLQGAPGWVLDYVLVHELSHLLAPAHDAHFWALVDRYPRAERAQGFLEGLAHAGEPFPGRGEPDDASPPDAPGPCAGIVD